MRRILLAKKRFPVFVDSTHVSRLVNVPVRWTCTKKPLLMCWESVKAGA
jgi:hypothetical protein